MSLHRPRECFLITLPKPLNFEHILEFLQIQTTCLPKLGQKLSFVR